MNEIQYCDGRRSGGRYPCLYLAKGGEVVKFTGTNVPGYCVVLTAQFEKAGIWSNTKFRLGLAPGVRPLEFLSPLHGVWGDDLASWGEVARKLQLPVEVAKAIVAAEFPSTAARLDAVEAFALEQEAQGATAETVAVSFGSPTRRQAEEGWWECPKEALTSDGRRVVVAPKIGPDGADWSAPVVVEPTGARIISSRHTRGYGGGSWTVEVAVPIPASTSAPAPTEARP